MRKLRRATRLVSLLPAATWAWKRRYALQSLVTLLRSAPERVRMGRGADLTLGLRVHAALLTDPILQGARIGVGSVSGNDGTVSLAAGAHDPHLEHAREVVCAVKGVTEVRIADEDPSPTIEATTATPPTAMRRSA